MEPYSCLVPVHSFQENYVKMVADLDHEELLAKPYLRENLS